MDSARTKEARDRFTDGKRRITTEAEFNAKWGLDSNPHMCDMCGHLFQIGEGWRWQYMNDHSPSYGNFSVCDVCDGPNVKERWLAAGKIANEKRVTPIMLALRLADYSRSERVAAHEVLIQIRDILRSDPGYDTCCDRIQNATDEYFREQDLAAAIRAKASEEEAKDEQATDAER